MTFSKSPKNQTNGFLTITLIKKVIYLFGFWRNNADYQRFMVAAVNREFRHNPKAIDAYETAILKMYYLNPDNIKGDFLPLFSATGRPSNQQPELFRSLLLMSHCRFAGIDEWVAHAAATPILCALVGVTPDSFPGASTHRDFLTRLWMTEKPDKKKDFATKPKGKHGKNKLPPKHPGIIAYMVEKALSGKVFQAIPERLLQTIFTKTAVIPSAKADLLGDTNNLAVSGDGTCVESHASHYGRKTCKCSGDCYCPRSFADPDAKWGWDSYHERWFYGYSSYLLSTHNKALKLDLPIYIKFTEASRHDGVSAIATLAHARFLYKDILSFDSFIADAAHDNYPTYNLLKQWQIKPFIDLSNRHDNNLQVDGLQLSKNGVPVCPDGHEMLNWGFDRHKYRIKYRCPMVAGKVKSCPYFWQCNRTSYGKIIYLRLASELRLLTPIPRGSPEWKETYKRRTASERVNNRLLTDYELEHPKRYGKIKLVSFAFLNAINIHLDAQVKFGSIAVSTIVS